MRCRPQQIIDSLYFNLERRVLRRSHTRQNLELIFLFLSIALRSPAGVSNCGDAQIECPPLAKNFVQLRIQHLEGIARQIVMVGEIPGLPASTLHTFLVRQYCHYAER
jgi:hypothetical protein